MSENIPTSEIDYGPLTLLIGAWQGDKGMDISPEPDGQEESPYYESITYTAIGNVTNAESQHLSAIRYQQIVRRKSTNEIFHDETGYWLWDAENSTVIHSLTIPRGVCILAGGQCNANENMKESVSLTVSAALDDPDWGIIQSPFMRDHARTVAFQHEVIIEQDLLKYSETMVLEIYAKTFNHIDRNELTRI